MNAFYYFNPSLLKPLLLISLTLGTLLISALLSKQQNKNSNRLLAFIITLALFFQGIETYRMLQGYTMHSLLIRSNFAISLLNSPLLYLYILTLTQKNFLFQKKYLLHLIPFGFGVIWYLFFLLFVHNQEYWNLSKAFLLEKFFRNAVIAIVFSFYLRLYYKQLSQFKYEMLNYFSERLVVRFQWLQILIAIASLFWALAVVDLATGPQVILWQYRPFLIALSLFILAIFALKQSSLFSEIELTSKNETKQKFSDEELRKWRVKLLDYMEKEAPYLNPELRLSDLSQSLNLKPYQLSEILNVGFGTNFFNFINRYRIAVAKERLADSQYNHMNILGIAMDSGFNSKSAFNETFRQFVGMPPSIFRSMQNSPKLSEKTS